MWWSRPNGDLWLLRASWTDPDDVELRRTQLRAWALAIRPSAGSAPCSLEEPGMTMVAADHAGSLEAHEDVWRSRREEITLLTMDGAAASSLANLLTVGPVEEVVIAGTEGWVARARESGDVVVGWRPPGNPAGWAALTIPAALAGEVDAITTAIEQT